jgi:protein phosphatase 1 regulatory subunit 37
VTTETVKTAPAPVARKAIPVKRKGVRRTTSPARAWVVEKTITTVTNR